MPQIDDALGVLLIDSEEFREIGLSPDDPLDRIAARGFRELVSLAVTSVLEHRSISVGTLLPRLFSRHDLPLPQEAFKTRSYRALVRAGIRTWGELAALAPAEILALRNAGTTTVEDIVACCVERCLSASPREDADQERRDPIVDAVANDDTNVEADRPDRARVLTDPATEQIGSMLPALSRIAAWAIRERNAHQLSNIWQINPDVGPIPIDLAEVWDELTQIELQQIADPSVISATLDELAEKLCKSFDEREWTVYRRRVIEGATLAEVGQEIGVTRERVRQIQRPVEQLAETTLLRDEFRPLLWRAADLRSSLGVAAPSNHEAARRALDRSLRGASATTAKLLRPVLLHLAGPYRERHGWLALANFDIKKATLLKAMTDEFGLLPIASAYEWLEGRGFRSEFHDAWLEQFGRFRRNGDSLVDWSGNVVDKCVAILALRREPADVETLVGIVREGHSVRGVRGRLFDDERVVRVNRTDWALRAWNLEEYSGITDEIAQRIGEAGGDVEVGAVVHEIARQFGVRENSVLVYTTAPMFAIEGTRIRLRRDDEPFEVGGTLSSCAGAFRLSQHAVSMVVQVDTDLLRGSGRALRGPIAAALGVSPGQPRSFRHIEGVLRVTWPMTSALGPSLGSLRRLASLAGAVAGDGVRLDFNLTQGTVSAERIPQDLGGYQDVEAIRLLTGIETGLDDAIAAVAEAIDASPINVRGPLIERGDAQLAELLPTPDVDPQLESTLTDLARMMS